MRTVLVVLLILVLCLLSYQIGKNDANIDYNKGRVDAYDSVIEALKAFQKSIESKNENSRKKGTL